MPYAPFRQNKNTVKFEMYASILEFLGYFIRNHTRHLHAKSSVTSLINQISFQNITFRSSQIVFAHKQMIPYFLL